ncbi:MAG: RNA polymerase sigma factor RpoH [Rhodospirillales bacterium]
MASTDYRPAISPDGSLSLYLQWIRRYPMLVLEEEVKLANRWRDARDLVAVDKLVTSHLRLVAKIAMGYRGYGLPLGDLISEGNVGMMQAVERFDPARGCRFSTYAMWWIRASIQQYILHSWSLVKMGTTASQKKLFFNLRKLKGQMQANGDSDLEPGQIKRIAARLNVPEFEVVNMNRRLIGPDHSLNAPLREDGEGEWMDWLVEECDDQEHKLGVSEELRVQRNLLAKAMTGLSDRERHIISERRLKDAPTTLQHLSQHHGVSRERIRQIEVRAFEKLRKSVKNTIIEHRISC